MKIQSLLLLCSSTALVWGTKCPPATGGNDAQAIERYKAIGQCSGVPEIVDTLEKRIPVTPAPPPKKPAAGGVPPKKPTTPETPTTPKPPTTPNTPPKNPPAPAGTPGAPCMYCGEGRKNTPTKPKPKNVVRHDNYGAMFERATTPAKPGQQQPATKQPVCVKPPASDRAGKRSISEVARDLIFPRGLTEKYANVDVFLGKNKEKWECQVGKYAPAGDAKDIPEITKYWTFKDPTDQGKCTVEVGRVAQIDIDDNDKYETDHVYEAQTLARFIAWLADENGNVGTTYKKPTADWVMEKILGVGKTPFYIVSPGNTAVGSLYTPSMGEIPVTLMAYGFGRSDGVEGISGGKKVERVPKERGNKNLVLLIKGINGPKGTWFKKEKPDSKWSSHASQEDARLEVRRGVGPFQYLSAREGTVDTMWKKWARVSNWIDLVCYTFDKQYKWGSDPGEPKLLPGKTGPVSLRSMYAFFIDKELKEIEETAATWAKDAKAGFEKKWEGAGKTPLTAAEKAWKTEAFGPNGYATAAKMKFPRPQGPPGTAGAPAGSGPYGAYGWGHAGNDARGVDPAIGPPTIIT